MDGQNRTKLVDSKIVFPHGITLDLVSRLVYWADAYLDYIEVVDYEGRNRHTIIQGLLVRKCTRNHHRLTEVVKIFTLCTRVRVWILVIKILSKEVNQWTEVLD